MKDLREFEKHLDAISIIVRNYKANKVVLGFPGILITMLEGCQRLDRTANEYIVNRSTFMRVLDEITDVLGHFGDDVSSEDFEKLKRHYGELQSLFSNHYAKTTERVCPRRRANSK